MYFLYNHVSVIVSFQSHSMQIFYLNDAAYYISIIKFYIQWAVLTLMDLFESKNTNKQINKDKPCLTFPLVMYLHKYGNNGDSVITEIMLIELLQAQNESKCDIPIHSLKQLQLCMHML